MNDVMYIGTLFAFLVATMAFVAACDRLAPKDTGSKP